MDVKYQYLCDTAYFKVVIDRQFSRGHGCYDYPFNLALSVWGARSFS
jgi:hypothetical protein